MAEVDVSGEIIPGECSFDAGDSNWHEVSERFLQSICPEQRGIVERILNDPYNGGWGLRLWVSSIIWGSALMPTRVPAEVIDIYLRDPDVIPLHDCCSCGMAVPVRPNRMYGHEAEPEHIYFPNCPVCSAPTGWYLFRTY